MSVSENLRIWDIQYLSISESQYLRISESEIFSISISQNLRIWEFHLRLSESWNVSIWESQNLRYPVSQYLRISESENLNILVSQNLRIWASKNLRDLWNLRFWEPERSEGFQMPLPPLDWKCCFRIWALTFWGFSGAPCTCCEQWVSKQVFPQPW